MYVCMYVYILHKAYYKTYFLHLEHEPSVKMDGNITYDNSTNTTQCKANFAVSVSDSL